VVGTQNSSMNVTTVTDQVSDGISDIAIVLVMSWMNVEFVTVKVFLKDTAIVKVTNGIVLIHLNVVVEMELIDVVPAMEPVSTKLAVVTVRQKIALEYAVEKLLKTTASNVVLVKYTLLKIFVIVKDTNMDVIMFVTQVKSMISVENAVETEKMQIIAIALVIHSIALVFAVVMLLKITVIAAVIAAHTGIKKFTVIVTVILKIALVYVEVMLKKMYAVNVTDLVS
jgi:hypothetical protein